MRTLVVEDDSLLAAGLVSVLARAGHGVHQVVTGQEAVDCLRQDDYDLVVLDVGLPDIDGFEVLRRLRARPSDAKVLVLTARGAVEDRVLGLDLGADDYLTKPFSVTEFEARVRALLRRIGSAPTPWVFDGLTVDVTAKRVRINDVPVELTPREWAILELFMARPGRVLSKDQIAQSLFAVDEQLSANAIEVLVSRLRTKIGPAEKLIRTVRGFGYVWEGADE